MAKSKITKEATATVERSFERNRVKSDVESVAGVIGIHQFETNPAEVGVTVGMTMNLGNFEFVRIDVSCKMPCYVEEMTDAYDFALNFAEDKLQEQVKLVRSTTK